MCPQPFISYSRHDLPFVRDLLRSLREAGMEPWIDLTNIPGGTPWNASIETALKNCSHCIVIVSPDSMKSNQVRREYEFALSQGKIVIPILLQTVAHMVGLQSIQWIDFRVTYSNPFRILVGRLKSETFTTNDYIGIPPRPLKFLGIAPVLSIACPPVVKIVAGFAFSSGLLKMLCGIVFRSSHLDDEVVIAVAEITTGLLFVFCSYRAANRRSTFFDIVFVAVIAIAIPLMGLFIAPKVMWPLIIAPLDAIALSIIVISRGYRRWMTAYAVGLGMREIQE